MGIKRFENFNTKSVTVLHGYKGAPAADRKKMLEDVGYNVIYPAMDFDMEWEKDRCKSLVERTIEECKDSDVIIGFSLGGYLAYIVGSILNKDVILVNPAMDRSVTKLNITDFDFSYDGHPLRVEVFFGLRDTLIPMKSTKDFLHNNSISYTDVVIDNMEHRCSPSNFKDILSKSTII